MEQLRQEGNNHFRRKNFQAAIEKYSEALDRSCGLVDMQQEVKCHVNRAVCHMHLDDYTSVAADCSAALDMQSANQKARYLRAVAYMHIGKTVTARSEFDRLQVMNRANSEQLLSTQDLVQCRKYADSIDKSESQATDGRLVGCLEESRPCSRGSLHKEAWPCVDPAFTFLREPVSVNEAIQLCHLSISHQVEGHRDSTQALEDEEPEPLHRPDPSHLGPQHVRESSDPETRHKPDSSDPELQHEPKDRSYLELQHEPDTSAFVPNHVPKPSDPVSQQKPESSEPQHKPNLSDPETQNKSQPSVLGPMMSSVSLTREESLFRRCVVKTANEELRPDIQTQRDIVQRLREQTERAAVGDIWALLPTGWLDVWNQYVEGTRVTENVISHNGNESMPGQQHSSCSSGTHPWGHGDQSTCQEAALAEESVQRASKASSPDHQIDPEPTIEALDLVVPPSPIGTSDLLEQGSVCAVKQGLEQGRDWTAVPLEIWAALQSWYGGGPAILRRVEQVKMPGQVVINLDRPWQETDMEEQNKPDQSSHESPLVESERPKPETDQMSCNSIHSSGPSSQSCTACQCYRPLLRCSRCRTAAYCSRCCQLSHWRYHKPLCRMDGKAGTDMSRRGRVGLHNLGNTCYMNSALQCLSHAYPITLYLLNNAYKDDLNRTSLLGTGGQLALAYENIMKELWFGSVAVVSPLPLKKAIAKFAPQFTGMQQHDAHEFLIYLLDALHEDLNRVKEKPYLEYPDEDDRPLPLQAKDAWSRSLARENSIIVDNLWGQYKSTIVCPDCKHISVVFEPFNMVTLELPDPTFRTYHVLTFPQIRLGVNRHSSTPRVVSIKMSCYRSIYSLRRELEARCGVGAEQTYVATAQRGRVERWWSPDDKLCHLERAEHVDGQNLERLRDLTPNRLHEGRVLMAVELSDWTDGARVYDYAILQQRVKGATGFSGLPMLLAFRLDWTVGRFVQEARRHLERVVGREAQHVRVVQMETDSTELRPWLVTVEMDEVKEMSIVDIDDMKETASTEIEVIQGNAEVAGSDTDLGYDVKQVIGNAGEQHGNQNGHSSENRPSLPRTEPSLDRPWKKVERRAEDLNAMEEETLLEDVLWLNPRSADRVRWFCCEWEIEPRSSFALRKRMIGSVHDASMNSTHHVNGPADEGKAESVVAEDSHCTESSETFEPGGEVLVEERTDADEEEEDQEDQGRLTLERCFRKAAKPERLDQDNSWYCRQCKTHKQAIKTIQLWRLPTVLIIALKRFDSRDRKLDWQVEFAVEGLDMAKHKVGPGNAEEMYDLFAVCCHHGLSRGWGHYTAFARAWGEAGCFDGTRWVEFDDGCCYDAPQETVRNCRNAYILMYRRREWAKEQVKV